MEPVGGIERITAGAQGVVVKARSYSSYEIFVARNGTIYYRGYNDHRANKVYNVLVTGIIYNADMA
jgi:hypothetical protein